MKTKTFTAIGSFVATYQAEEFLKERGFSIGQMESNAPRAIRFGDCTIAKWRNLSTRDKAAMHGAITGDVRNGPVTIDLLESAPAAAFKAFSAEPATAEPH
jgi:hypothetical protein